MKNILISIGVIAVLVGGFFLLNQHIYDQKQADSAPATSSPATSSEEAAGDPISVSGEIACLPKVGDGPQTLECAIGFEADNGSYYSLQTPVDAEIDYQLLGTGTKVEIEGRLTSEEQHGPDGNRYYTAGTIVIETIEGQ